MHTVLLLGGTGEARALADRLAGRPGLRVVTSLAGRVARPALPAGAVRIGGFGGPDGLAAWLRAERVTALVDATHPFAARISGSAEVAAARTGTPLLVLRRPGWTAGPGDDWRRVPSLDAAAGILPGLGERVFLTTGRQGVAAFAHLDRHRFLLRAIEPPAPPVPRRLEVILHRGPFTVQDEVTVLRRYAIEVLVTKDSGGAMTAAKLAAARTLGLPVVMVDRPPSGPAPAVSTVDAALSWVDAHAG